MWIARQEMIEILDKPYLDVGDIAKLIGCKTAKASQIKTEVRKQIEMKGLRTISTRYINTSALVEYLQNDYITELYRSNLKGRDR